MRRELTVAASTFAATRQGNLNHIGNDGSTPSIRARRQGFQFSGRCIPAENMALDGPPQSVFDRWKASPLHLAILETRLAQFAGIGISDLTNPDKSTWVLNVAGSSTMKCIDGSEPDRSIGNQCGAPSSVPSLPGVGGVAAGAGAAVSPGNGTVISNITTTAKSEDPARKTSSLGEETVNVSAKAVSTSNSGPAGSLGITGSSGASSLVGASSAEAKVSAKTLSVSPVLSSGGSSVSFRNGGSSMTLLDYFTVIKQGPNGITQKCVQRRSDPTFSRCTFVF